MAQIDKRALVVAAIVDELCTGDMLNQFICCQPKKKLNRSREGPKESANARRWRGLN